jgi:hypothetical protein
MNEVLARGDEVRIGDRLGSVVSIEKMVGLYVLDVNGATVAAYRHEFVPTKWIGDTLGNTGIGCCAKNGSEEIAA